MTKREAIWVAWGLGLGAAACFVAIFGFGFRTHAGDGRLVVVTLLGGGWRIWPPRLRGSGSRMFNKRTQAPPRP